MDSTMELAISAQSTALPSLPPPPLTCISFRPVGKARKLFAKGISTFAATKDHQHLRYYRVDDRPQPIDIGANAVQLQERLQAKGEADIPGNFFFAFTELDPSKPADGLTVGRGSLKGDSNPLLIPDLQLSAPNDARAHNLEQIHATFQPEDGTGLFAVTIKAHTNKRTYLVLADGRKELLPGSRTVLASRVNRLELGDMAYDFVYEEPRVSKEVFLAARKRYIEQTTGMPFQTYPGDWSTWWPTFPPPLGSRWGVRLKSTIGRGGFGWVTAGIDIKTETLVAVKEFNCHSPKTRAFPIDEFRAARALAWIRNLVTPLRLECEHAHPEPDECVEDCKTVIIFPLAYGSLYALGPGLLKNNRPVLWRILRTSLEGLARIHFFGYIHRDISARNVVIEAFHGPNGPQGAIIDMGAMIKALTCKVVYSPLYLQPPEAALTTELITDKADIFDFGRMIADIMDFKALALDEFPKLAEYKRVQAFVRDPQNRFWGLRLYDLVGRMLAIDPDDRPTAQQALDDPCWREDFERLPLNN